MIAHRLRAHRRSLLITAAASGAIALGGMASPAAAQLGPRDRGYVGPAYLQVPGVSGGWKGAPYRNWVKTEAHVWKSDAPLRRPGSGPGGQGAQGAGQGTPAGQPGQAAQRPQGAQGAQAGQQAQGQGGGAFGRRRAFLSVPGAPRSGQGTLVVTVDKRNPALSALMAKCQSKAPMPEVTYAVSAHQSRQRLEMGPRPADVPEYFDLKLKDVQFAECPVVDKAPEQAFVVRFADIEWLNWQQQAMGAPVTLQPAVLRPIARPSGKTRAWVVNWIAFAHDVSDDQCPVANAKPTEADYYAQMSKEEAEKERAALAGQGGPNYENGQMGRRGPGRLDVTFLPGIVPDPGWHEPQTKVARGLNLDGDDGKRAKHKNYVSDDGRQTGIDNQLYTVMGCVLGWQGHKGFLLQFANNQMADGEMSILVEISGIDDERDDDEVFVTLRYSLDDMVKNSAGNQILRDYSFQVTDNPEFSHYFIRVPAKIANGVVTTERIQDFRFNMGIYGVPNELRMANAGLRLELKPDGTIKGVIGGYRDWREVAATYPSSSSEFYHGFQQPGLYNALRRNADGLKDPVTGEFTGISTAYDIEGVPAFVVEEAPKIANEPQAPTREARAEIPQGTQ